jgi:hypothetical protein
MTNKIYIITVSDVKDFYNFLDGKSYLSLDKDLFYTDYDALVAAYKVTRFNSIDEFVAANNLVSISNLENDYRYCDFHFIYKPAVNVHILVVAICN